MASEQAPLTPLDEPFARAMAERAQAAFNAHDVEAFAALWADDVTVEHSAAPATLRGRHELKAFYERSWKAFPDARLELRDGPFLHPHAPRGSALWQYSATNTGPIVPPGFAATGRRVELPIMETAEFRDGLVTRFQVVMDVAGFMRQLGLLAAPGSRAERAMAAMQRLQMKLRRGRPEHRDQPRAGLRTRLSGRSRRPGRTRSVS